MMTFDKEALTLAVNEAVSKKRACVGASFCTPKNSRGYACTAEGCSRWAYASGFCNAHYIRNRSGRNMSEPVRTRKRDDTCSECGEVTGARGGWGLCPKHYKQLRSSTIKDALVEAMGGSCFSCSEVFHRKVFDFHHLGDKDGSASWLIANGSVESIAEELSKCTLLCANCHRMEHSND